MNKINCYDKVKVKYVDYESNDKYVGAIGMMMGKYDDGKEYVWYESIENWSEPDESIEV